MHVLLLPSWYPTPQRPNIGTFFQDQAAALRRVGIRVGVAYVEPRSLRSFRLGALRESHFHITVSDEMGIPTMRLHGWNTLAQTVPGGMIWTYLTDWLVGRYTRAFGEPDILHAHGSVWGGYAAMRSSTRRVIPFVVTEHSSALTAGSMPPRLLRKTLKVLKRSDSTIAVSDPLRQRLIKCGVDSAITVIPNTVDLDFWSLPPWRRGGSTFSFCAIGHLTVRKGFDLLIRAFAAAFRDQPGVQLLIGGDGPHASELKALAKTVAREGQVKFVGSLSRAGVRNLMWEANCLVLPSKAETFGVVIVEALATGIPAIVTRCGGPEGIVTPDVGIVVEPGDEERLADAMIMLRAGATYRRSVLRAHAEQFSYETVGADLARMYESTLARQ